MCCLLPLSLQYPCVTARTCVANGYSCVGVCPKGEAVCPTTDICHPVTMETTCDGSNTTCLSGQVLIQNANGIRSCRNPARLVLHIYTCLAVDKSTLRPHLSVPQMSSSLTFRSSFYWNKSTIVLLYTILLLPHFIHNFIQNGCARISEV